MMATIKTLVAPVDTGRPEDNHASGALIAAVEAQMLESEVVPPEELMAAAHAACYAMALNGTLGRKSASAERTLVTATVANLGTKVSGGLFTVTLDFGNALAMIIVEMP